MPNDAPNASTRTSSTHRLLLPPKSNAPPPPIPPRLLSRFMEPPKPSSVPSSTAVNAPKWIDRDEFATASKGHKPHVSPTQTSAHPAVSPPLPYGPNSTLPPPSQSTHVSYDSHFSSRGGWPPRASEGRASQTKTTS